VEVLAVQLELRGCLDYNLPRKTLMPEGNRFREVRFVLLDRDGVINRKPPEGSYVGHWRDFELLSGTEAAIAALNRSGRRVLVASNQRGIALGLYSSADVNDTHNKLQNHLASRGACIDGFYFCPHDKDECSCRKPKTGLFIAAMRDFPELKSLSGIVIGDALSDIEFARNLGLPSIFIRGLSETQSPGGSHAADLADAVSSSLAEAVEKYL
jgi:D-glycero-D-manno-heptose 1,7-bisphosphate phosphatase